MGPKLPVIMYMPHSLYPSTSYRFGYDGGLKGRYRRYLVGAIMMRVLTVAD